MQDAIFVTGATGYMGSRLVPVLLQNGHAVTALVRPGSKKKVVGGCKIALGDALKGESYRNEVEGCGTFIHLCGVSHPSPAKAREFVEVDLGSTQEAVRIATAYGIRHFVYVSVAHPAPLMKAYVNTRTLCEDLVIKSGMNATILQPWYVLGPGHRWPLALKPVYALAEHIPSMREGARRLGLVSIREMIGALAWSVEHPATGVRVIEVPELRAAGREFRISTAGRANQSGNVNEVRTSISSELLPTERR